MFNIAFILALLLSRENSLQLKFTWVLSYKLNSLSVCLLFVFLSPPPLLWANILCKS